MVASRLNTIRKAFSNQGLGSISLHYESSLAILTLNNPSKKNALSPHMMSQLADHVDQLEQAQDVYALVLQGRSTFCSGFDLSLATINSPYLSRSFASDMTVLMQDTLNRLYRLPLLSVAAIEGYAYGGGAELMTACDFRVMHQDAKIRFVHANMGVTTGWGGTHRLMDILPPQKALRLLASAPIVSCTEAYELGLVDHMAPRHDSVLEATRSFIDTFIYTDATKTNKRSLHSIQAFKQLKSLQCTTRQSLASLERDVFIQLWGQQDHLNAMNQRKK